MHADGNALSTHAGRLQLHRDMTGGWRRGRARRRMGVPIECGLLCSPPLPLMPSLSTPRVAHTQRTYCIGKERLWASRWSGSRGAVDGAWPADLSWIVDR